MIQKLKEEMKLRCFTQATQNAYVFNVQKGTDLRYIQALSGHKRLETTQIYTRVAKHNLTNIKNPLD